MKYLGKTRRFYRFKTDRPMYFIDRDVICEGSTVKFYRPDPQNKGKRTFDTPGECIQFLNNKVNNMDPITKETESKGLDFNKVTIIKSISGTDWNLLSPFLPEGSSKQKDDFTLFTDYLVNNWKDRDRERFPKNPTLNRFNKTIIGRQKLISHQWGTYGIGRYFKSTLKSFSPEEIIELMHDSHPNPKFLDHLKMIEDIDGGLYWMLSKFYVPNHKDDAIQDLESGIPNSSIGFIGMVRRPYVDDKTDETLWTDIIPGENGEYGEAVEGSLVGVESQFGAGAKSFSFKSEDGDAKPYEVIGIVVPFKEAAETAENKDMHYYERSPADEFEMISKQNTDNGEGTFYDVFYGYKENTREIQSLAYPKKLWTKEKAKKHAASLKDPADDSQSGDSDADDKTKKSQKNNGGFSMKFYIEALGFTKDSEIEDQEGLDKITKSINEAIVEKIKEEVETAREELEEAHNDIVQVYTKTLELENVAPEDLEKHLTDLAEKAKNGVSAREKMIEEIVKYKLNLGLVENEEDDLKAERETLDVLTMEQLAKQRDQFKVKDEKDHPGRSQLNGDVDPDKDKDKQNYPKYPKRSFQETV